METRLELRAEQSRTLAMTARLRQAIGLLRLGNRALAEHLQMLAAANPHLALTAAPRPAPTQNWLDQMQAPPPVTGHGRPVAGGAGGAASDAVERAVAPPPGLVGHVSAQIGLLVRDPADRALAEAFVAALEPSGWLAEGPAEIARACGASLARAERVLAQLQGAEPAGLFARSLTECLRLQAADRGLLASDFAGLLENLPLLARGDLVALAARCGCSGERLNQMVRDLRGLNPKPGAAFGAAPDPITEPDLIVRREGGGWTVELNRSTLPAITVRETPDAADDALLRDARWLERAVARRNATTLRIAREMLARQPGLLATGKGAMVPLSVAEVAAATGLHASTISRVTAGMMVACPRGTLSLRDFFSAARPARGGGEVATARILHDMRALIAAEDRAAPLRDADIARHFEARGVVLARRTVAKYRAQLGFAGAAARRKR